MEPVMEREVRKIGDWELAKARIGQTFDDLKGFLRHPFSKPLFYSSAASLAALTPGVVIAAPVTHNQQELEFASRLAAVPEVALDADAHEILEAEVPINQSEENLPAGAVRLEDGSYFAGETGWGWTVSEDMMKAYQQYGGAARWGGFISGSWKDSIGRETQAAERGIFQLTRTDDGGVVTEWDNVFDRMHDLGKDGWLQTQKNTPPVTLNWSELDRGLGWGHTKEGPLPQTVEENHLKIIFEMAQKYPQLKDAILSNPLWFEQYGLPVAFADSPELAVVRCQRAVVQLWKNSTPWTSGPMEITIALAGTTAKEAGMISATALRTLSLEQARKEAEKKMGVVDVLGLPRWSDFKFIKRNSDGSITIDVTGTEVLLRNGFDTVQAGDSGFELLVKMHMEQKEGFPPQGLTGNITLQVAGDESKKTLITFESGKYLKLTTWDLLPGHTTMRTAFSSYVAPQLLKIEVGGVGDSETWSFYDANSGQLIVNNIRLPMPVRTSARDNLIFGFYPQSGLYHDSSQLIVDTLKFKNKS